MGNSSSVPVPPEEPLPPPMFVPGSCSIEQPKVEVVNPGPFEQLHAHVREICPQPFEGATLTVNKPLSNRFHINHNLILNNNPKTSGYTFGSTYVHLNGDKPSVALSGNMASTGNFTGNVTGMLNENTKCRASFQEVEGHFSAEFSAEYSGSDYVASAKIANIDPITQTGLCLFQYLQSWGKRLAVGAELLYLRLNGIPGKQQASFGLGGRYIGDDWLLAGTVNPMDAGLKLSGCKKINKNFVVAAEFEGSLVAQECSAGIGYKYSLPERDAVFKGSINSNLVVMATMEKELNPLPCTFALSGIADLKNNKYGWGIGLMIE